MSTVSSVASTIRTRLQETTASQWSDAQIIYQIAAAEQWLADLIGKFPGSGKYRYTETFTLTANAETYTLSSLTKPFAEMLEIGMQYPSGVFSPLATMEDAQEFTWRGPQNWNPGGFVRPAYRLLDDTIQFLPKSESDRTMRITYRFLPTVKTSSGDTLETPQREDYVLITRVLHFLLGDAREKNMAFEEEHASMLAELEARWCGRQYGSNTETVKRRASPMLYPN